MRISDWSSDVCSSDLFFSRDAGVYPATLHVAHADASTAGTCCAPLATAGSIHAPSQMCPSGSAKLRLNMTPCYSTGLGSEMPPFATAVSSSEERSVGKEDVTWCKSRWSQYHYKKKK